MASITIKRVTEADFLPRISGFASARAAPLSDAARSKKRILIIDDDSNTTRLVKILLERSGPYLVMEENDATTAHQSAHNFKPDVIFLEVVMPETDGGEVATQIQADPDLCGTAMIFLTALVTRAEAKSGLRIQGHPSLAKPVSIPELINAIEKTSACARKNLRLHGEAAYLSKVILKSYSRVAPQNPADAPWQWAPTIMNLRYENN
jgi:CheY-like chemotaxis protein